MTSLSHLSHNAIPRLYFISLYHQTKVNPAQVSILRLSSPSCFLRLVSSPSVLFVFFCFFTHLSRCCRGQRLDYYDLVSVWLNFRLESMPRPALDSPFRAKVWLAKSHITRPGRFSTLSSPNIYNSPFTLNDAPPSGCQPRATGVASFLHLLQPVNSSVQTSLDTSPSLSRGRNFTHPPLAR